MHLRNPNELWEVLRSSCKWRSLIAVVLLASLGVVDVSPAGAQTETIQVWSSPGSSSQQARNEKFPVSGTVVNAVTGEPIRKALVQINGPQPRNTFSDGDGRFRFDEIPAGQISVIARKPGYFSEQELRPQLQLPVEVGPKSDSVLVKLTPESVISGKVTNATGIPLEHVPLNLTYIGIREGRRRWEFKGNTMSDDSGRFRFANLQPGKYYLGAGPYTPLVITLFDDDQVAKTGYPGMYYPGVPDLASASPIELSAGQQSEANFALNETPVYSVSGTVGGFAANQGVSLQVLDASGVQVPTGVQFNSENGRFDVRALPPGTYVLKAFSSLGPNQTVRAEARLNVASNIYNLHLMLGPVASIPISVRTESTAPAATGALNDVRRSPQGFMPPGPPLAVRLLANQPGVSDSYSTLEGPPGQQQLSLRNVEPGRYSVDLIPQGTWYVQSAEYGQTNLLTDDLTLTADAPPLTMEVVLRNDTAMLSGTVSPGSGASLPAFVVAVPERFPKASPKVAYYYPPQSKSAEPADGFMIPTLAPGDYLVFAFDHADGIEYSNPEVLQNYISQATHVTLVPNQRTKVTLTLIRTEGESN